MPKRQARAARRAIQSTHQAQLLKLPESVLISILQHVPTFDRLACCTLVCKAWASAVASTTVDLGAEPDEAWYIDGAECSKSIQSWLHLRGPQVASMNLRYRTTNFCDRPLGRLLLPCSKLSRLETLHLQNACVLCAQQGTVSTRSTSRISTCQLLAASHSSGSSAATTEAAAAANGPNAFMLLLRHLQLENCWVTLDSFQQLTKLTALTELHLPRVILCTSSWRPVNAERYAAAFTSVLQHLQGLESLFLGYGISLQQPGAALATLSTMQHLQQLTLCAANCDTDSLAHLPISLTHLSLEGKEQLRSGELDISVTSDSLPQLSLLQSLDLYYVSLEPQVLDSLSALRRLSLNCVTLGDPAVDDWDVQQEELRKAFLTAIGQLAQLEHLRLTGMCLDQIEDLQLFTALTASSHLTALHLRELPCTPLPEGALQHILPQDRHLPNLKSLQLVVDERIRFYGHEWRFCRSDMSCLASCLPGLEDLCLWGVVGGSWEQPSLVPELKELLPGLTSLQVDCDTLDDY